MTEHMSGAEFRCLREYCGLTAEWMTQHLQVNKRTVIRWEAGRNPVPSGAAGALRAVAAAADELVAELVAGARNVSGEAVLRTYFTDDALSDAHPDLGYPAAWHRAAVIRAAQQLPGCRIEYA
ncbi:MAG: helix-turn-helix domain-containing protein [Stackebrandtia sp.]